MVHCEGVRNGEHKRDAVQLQNSRVESPRSVIANVAEATYAIVNEGVMMWCKRLMLLRARLLTMRRKLHE